MSRLGDKEDTGVHRLRNVEAQAKSIEAAERIMSRCAELVSIVRPERPVVVIVEDDPILMPAYLRILEEHAHVVACTTAAEGKKTVREVHPDLVILDLHLPDGSGIDVLRELRSFESGALVRVLVVSAYLDERVAEAVLAVGGPLELVDKAESASLVRALHRHAGAFKERGDT